ncbi:DUF2946 family protein [Roseateles sp. SL47]|uniref:DUF2946 family protein n=1 Tax=Roseateles sp. SL47 TaxID=2995138 RepID=UPI0022712873|nr:DUF2946 family protein [Roseateles sp. SL47]WAC72962.1 DUF2946 family protein [Roseateles sp. SL47]
MRLTRGSKFITSWVALLALLMMSLAPLVSQAMGANRAWLEVCGATGPKWVRVGVDLGARLSAEAHADADADAGVTADADLGGVDSPSPGQPFAADPMGHCPYCSLHADTLGMPPSPLVVLPLMPLRDVPPAFLSAPSTLHAWRTAQARGPPLSA